MPFNMQNLLGLALDDEDVLTPDQLKGIKQQSQQALALHLLAAGGPSSQPINFGQAVAQGVLQSQQQGQAAMDRQRMVNIRRQGLALDQQKAAMPQYQNVGNRLVQIPGLGGGDPRVVLDAPPEAPKPQTQVVDGVLYERIGDKWTPQTARAPAAPEKPQTQVVDGVLYERIGGQWKPQTTKAPDAAGGAAQKERAQKLAMMESSLANYEQKLANGPAWVPGSTRKASLEAAHRDLQLQAKELYSLGVLAGPDMDLLNSVIVDPTSMAANLNPEILTQNMAEVKGVLERAKAALSGQVVQPATNNLLPKGAQLPPGAFKVGNATVLELP